MPQKIHYRKQAPKIYILFFDKNRDSFGKPFNASGYDLEQIEIADKCLSELHAIDTKGFVFRYPTTFDLQHQLKFDQLDYLHSIHWMIGLFNFLDGCASMLDNIYEYECEMKANYS